MNSPPNSNSPVPPPSVADPSKPRSAQPRPGGWRAARLLHLLAASIALGAACYLTIQKWQGKITDLAGCGGSEGCSQLLGGRWANWMLVPVSFWAITVYLPLLVLGIMGLTSTTRAKFAWAGAGILSAGAIWFISLQLFVEHRFCIWCFTMHSCSLILLTSIILQTRHWLARHRSIVATGIGAAVTAACLLIGGQVFGPQPMSHELTSTLAEADKMTSQPETDAEVLPDDSENAASPLPNDSAPTSSRDPSSLNPESADSLPQAQTPTQTQSQAKARLQGQDAAEPLSGISATGSKNDQSPAVPASSGVAKSTSEANGSSTASESHAFDSLPEFDEEPAKPTSDETTRENSSENRQSESNGSSANVRPLPSNRETVQADLPSVSDQDASHAGGRVVDFLNGELRLNLAEVPVIGDPAAPTVVVKYFDYTCKSCRTMHDQLSAIQEQFPGQLAIVMLPCPLDRDCNPYGPPGTAHRDACQYARLGLAVWRADATKFREFHDELFHRQGKTTVAEARELAAKLVGEERLTKALEDPWVRANLRSTFALYRRMSAQNPRMPKIVLTGSVIMHGLARNQDELTQVLQQQAGLRK